MPHYFYYYLVYFVRYHTRHNTTYLQTTDKLLISLSRPLTARVCGPNTSWAKRTDKLVHITKVLGKTEDKGAKRAATIALKTAATTRRTTTTPATPTAPATPTTRATAISYLQLETVSIFKLVTWPQLSYAAVYAQGGVPRCLTGVWLTSLWCN